VEVGGRDREGERCSVLLNYYEEDTMSSFQREHWPLGPYLISLPDNRRLSEIAAERAAQLAALPPRSHRFRWRFAVRWWRRRQVVMDPVVSKARVDAKTVTTW
jgi:hypothetical protein